jgi:FAD/FMN-containing dehydrogenase
MMTHENLALLQAQVREFKAAQRGEVLDLSHPGYEDARHVWNGVIDVRPELIARCTGVADVVNTVNFARDHNLRVAMRCGGHHPSGYGVCDEGLVLDLRPMKGMRVDPIKRTVHAQPGLNWTEFDRETAVFGLATPGGNVGDTGVSGLTVGGGIGWLSRKYGLTCDNLLSADIVTADGRCLIASSHENKELFWGIRGGGGNFGVVTSFEFQLYPVTMVVGGWVVYSLDQAKAYLKFLREYFETVPDGLSLSIFFINAHIDPSLSAIVGDQVVVAAVVCFTGAPDEGERVLKPLRTFATPIADLIGPMPYTVQQGLGDRLVEPGLPCYEKSVYLKNLCDDVIEVLVDQAAAMTSPLTHLHFVLMGGAIARIAEDETAVPHRKAAFDCYILPIWRHGDRPDRHIEWARKTFSQLQPFSTGGGYLNRHQTDSEDEVQAAYGAARYERLVAVKNKYDPTNFFRVNHNIKPTVV